MTTSTDRSRSDEFASFMRAYQDMVFSTAARITASDAAAEDIAQEVFIKAYENFDKLHSSPTPGGWLKTVARNLSLNYISRYRRRWRFFGEMHNDQDEELQSQPAFTTRDCALERISQSQRHAAIERALKSLPEQQRIPLVLYHFEEMSYEAIAQQLHVSLAKIKTDIFRARTALAKTLTRDGITLESESYS